MIDAMYERTLQVVEERQKEITQVAELLLEKETINVDDVVTLIGQRPHEMPKSYEDIVSTNWDASTGTDADAEESPIEDAEEVDLNDEEATKDETTKDETKN